MSSAGRTEEWLNPNRHGAVELVAMITGCHSADFIRASGHGAAPKGRTHDRTHGDRSTATFPLHHRGRPHMTIFGGEDRVLYSAACWALCATGR